jgi:3-oxoacyl-[acyl-carrier-protein] synthase II
MSEVRVVLTGIGLLTGLGATREATWNAVRQGKSAVRPLDFPRDEPPFWGCASPLVVPPDREPVLDLLDHVTDEAIVDSRFVENEYRPERLGVLIGSSKGGIRSLGRLHDLLCLAETRTGSEPSRCLSPFPPERRPPSKSGQAETAEAWSRSSPSAGASRLARRIGAIGACLTPVAACATGLLAVLQGAELIRRGVVDAVFAGSVDAALEPILLRSFRTMRVLAPSTGEPTAAIRPWDRNRRGFLVGEGGAVFVLETADRARARGVLPYAEIAGGAIGADAHHETALNPDPAGLAHVLTSSLEHSRLAAHEIDLMNVHGTATRSNDVLECLAVRRAFGRFADRISCTANKGQIGHVLGAAGSAELALTCLALRDGFVPPTINLTDPDPLCDLDATPNVGRERTIHAALKFSIGFGGHLAAAVLHRHGSGPYREKPEARLA